ncbi:SCO family protein [Ulvibacterium sp.]|uniref:SCO family protein n=1 Tax=Ulvibacterium sp. TaxID=2665914 RepID=UPI00262CA576|nr:SCO family protein [Ulvibacterium sp.]
MKRFKDKLVLLLVLILATLGCRTKTKKEVVSRVATLPYYTDTSFTPQWLAQNSDSIFGLHQIAPFQLINQLGDTVTQKTFTGKIYVADFFFTSCPGICPKMTANMALVQEAFKEDKSVLLLSHSVTPEYDSVPILRTYADAKGVIPNKWHLVTGERNIIYDLGRYAYFVEEDLGVPKGENDFLHTENFILVDKNRHIRGIYNGLNMTAIAQLIADIKTLKKEG